MAPLTFSYVCYEKSKLTTLRLSNGSFNMSHPVHTKEDSDFPWTLQGKVFEEPGVLQEVIRILGINSGDRLDVLSEQLIASTIMSIFDDAALLVLGGGDLDSYCDEATELIRSTITF